VSLALVVDEFVDLALGAGCTALYHHNGWDRVLKGRQVSTCGNYHE
jgi:hypothetical protein